MRGARTTNANRVIVGLVLLGSCASTTHQRAMKLGMTQDCYDQMAGNWSHTDDIGLQTWKGMCESRARNEQRQATQDPHFQTRDPRTATRVPDNANVTPPRKAAANPNVASHNDEVIEHATQTNDQARADEQVRIDQDNARREYERMEQERAAREQEAKDRKERETTEAAAHIARCQAALDTGDVAKAKSCWSERDWSKTNPPQPTDQIVACLDQAASKVADGAACFRLADTNDDAVWKKDACLSSYRTWSKNAPPCGPLTITAYLATTETNFDFSTKIATFEQKKLKPLQDRCGTPSATMLVTGLKIGKVDERKATGCEYSAPFAVAQYFTGDNWLVVGFGGNSVVAVKTNRKASSGTILRGLRLRFRGLKRFTLTNQTADDIPAFVEIK